VEPWHGFLVHELFVCSSSSFFLGHQALAPVPYVPRRWMGQMLGRGPSSTLTTSKWTRRRRGRCWAAADGPQLVPCTRASSGDEHMDRFVTPFDRLLTSVQARQQQSLRCFFEGNGFNTNCVPDDRIHLLVGVDLKLEA
jgi:hypothetical protein